jgi:hypothetical protein
MNGFLVVQRYGGDDLPVALCSTLAEALAMTVLQSNDAIRELFSTDSPENLSHVCTHIVEFRNGQPVGGHPSIDSADEVARN